MKRFLKPTLALSALLLCALGMAQVTPPWQRLPTDTPSLAFPGPYVTAVRNPVKHTVRISVAGVYHGPPATLVAEGCERIPASPVRPWEKVTVDADPASPMEPILNVEEGDDFTFGLEVPDIGGSDAYGVWCMFSYGEKTTLERQYLTKMMPR